MSYNLPTVKSTPSSAWFYQVLLVLNAGIRYDVCADAAIFVYSSPLWPQGHKLWVVQAGKEENLWYLHRTKWQIHIWLTVPHEGITVEMEMKIDNEEGGS